MTPATNTNHKAIEEVLCSKTTLKILKVLIGSQLTPSQIAKAVGVSYANAVGHLQTLEAEGILVSVKFGVLIRFYKSNEVSPIATAVQRLIESFKID